MERLIDPRIGKRLAIVCVFFAATGLAYNVAPRPKQVEREEADIAAMLPVKAGSFTAQLAPGQYCTYKLDKVNYDVLQPWGIIARVFTHGAEQYEVVVIASHKKESFHDPQVCLTAQGWALSNQREDTLQTSLRGTLPITLFDMDKGGQKLTAMYFLKMTSGYHAGISDVKWDMFKYKVAHVGIEEEGAFVRIIPSNPTSVEQLKKFASEWVDEATKTSKGYY